MRGGVRCSVAMAVARECHALPLNDLPTCLLILPICPSRPFPPTGKLGRVQGVELRCGIPPVPHVEGRHVGPDHERCQQHGL